MRWILVLVITAMLVAPAAAQTPAGEPTANQPLVPGVGVKIAKVGDDFEDTQWRYVHNGPKASQNIDKQIREPIGISANERIFESTYRGHPDVVKRVATPVEGIPGSKGALLMRSRATGAPGRVSGEQQQDDLMVNVYGALGREIEPRYSPSCTVRVYVPEWDEWEPRSGSSFGFRLDCEAHGVAPSEVLWTTRKKKGWHQYWPGIFLVLRRKEDGFESTHARVLIRGDENGHELDGPLITRPGWHTLGMSITPDGRVHYFLREGAGELRGEDHIASQFPYGLRCEKFNLMFFNIVNHDDGQSWSTPWIIDDPSVYYVPEGWAPADVRKYMARRQGASRRFVVCGATPAASAVPLRYFSNDAKPFVLRR